MTENLETNPVMSPGLTAPPTSAAPLPATPSTPAMAAFASQAGTAPIGKIRSTGTCVLLTIVTLGIYTWAWYFKTHNEMKAHSGTGLGGGLALLLSVFVSIAMPFVTSSEVGGLYERRGEEKPVSGTTGLWILLPLIGQIVWFVKTNGALNAYWRSVGAQD